MNYLSVCSKCGGELLAQNDSTFKCKFCGAVFREDTVQKQKNALAAILDEEKMSRVAALKKELWKKVNEEYIDSVSILRICRDIRAISPDDFYATFYEAANSESEDLFISQLENLDAIEHYDDVDEILDFSLKSISPKNMLAICNLIERAYKQNDLSKYNEYRARYDEQCSLLNDCVYDPAYPRDVFICYSKKDMPKVESLVKFLEEKGLLCFVEIRNLQHGRGAVSNYWNALHTAIENCKCVVFLSSVNSRDQSENALTELRYVLSLEQKLNRKIKKIEYLIDEYTGHAVERNFKKIFEGLECCHDENTVLARITWDEPAAVPEALPDLPTQKEVKYCTGCGKENPDNAKYCRDCGGDTFVATQKELFDYLKRQTAEAERRNVQTPPPAPKKEEPVKQKSDAKNRAASENDYFSGNMTFQDVDTPAEKKTSFSDIWRRKNSFEYYSGSDRFELIKGQHVLIPETEKRIKVTLENSYKLDNVEADLFVFLLDGNDRVLSESDLVFFGNPTSLNKSVQMSRRGDSVEVFLNKINQDIVRVRFILAFNMENGKVRNFSMMNHSDIVFCLKDQAYSFRMADIGRFESVSAFEFYRIRNKWKINIQAAGLREDIKALCTDYGVEVE